MRILDCGENYTPDFNLVDYAISRYPIEFQDRHFYLPGCISAETVLSSRFAELSKKDRNYTQDAVKEKEFFASFIAGHESEGGIRGNFFKELCKYKRVESVGSYLNNMPDGKTVKWADDSKTTFQRKCKFSLCFESTKHEGFVTEKISDAFYADTIPIYYGSANVTEIFNPKAFINCSDYDSFEAVLEKIRELDEDDEKYLEMLRQPILNDPEIYDKTMAAHEKFICSIFDQEPEKAYRRSRVYWPMEYESWNERQKGCAYANAMPFGALIKTIFRRIKRKLFKK